MRLSPIASVVLLAGVLVAPLTVAAQTQTDKVHQLLAHTTQVIPKQQRDNDLRRYKIRGTDVEGYINPETLTDGFLANGQEVFILPLVSGGSGGVFYTLLFTKISEQLRFVGYIPSANGHLDVTLDGGRIRVITPIYKVGDPDCCPSSHNYDYYTLTGIRLVKVRD